MNNASSRWFGKHGEDDSAQRPLGDTFRYRKLGDFWASFAVKPPYRVAYLQTRCPIGLL
jgi:hypothetical protein